MNFVYNHLHFRSEDPDAAAKALAEAESIAAELDAIDLGGTPQKKPSLTRYSLERRVATRLRKNIHHNALGRLVRKVRWACDVLLR